MNHACPPGGERPLTEGERALVRTMFGSAVDLDPVRIRRRKWFPFQPANVVMAPQGHVHFHPFGPHYCDDFVDAPVTAQGLFIHEMVHVWQAQTKGRHWLVLHRHPFCRYLYTFEPGRAFGRYGIEQQAEIVRHAFLARIGYPESEAPSLTELERVLPF